jgi:ATP-dependent Lon protease
MDPRHNHLLRGYASFGGLLVPKAVLARLNDEAEQADEAADEESADEQAAAGEEAPPQVEPKRTPGQPRSMLRRVFLPESVNSFAAQIDGLHRNSDRRKSMQAMLAALQRGPLGLREVALIPKRLAKSCDLLREEMPNFGPVVDRLQVLLELQQAGDRTIRLPPILLGGPAGVGKTYFAQRFAELMRLQYEVVNMETTTASWVLTGGDLGWMGGGVGAVYKAIVEGLQANPLFVLDELDKALDSKYPPINTLYALLEPGTARVFRDEACREVPLDASAINWVATANEVERIPDPLRNRMLVFDVPMPSPGQKQSIARSVYRDLRRQERWGRRFSKALPDASVRMLAAGEGSVRAMRSLLMLGFANALRRGSRSIEPSDIRQALHRQLSPDELETLEPAGRA